MVAKTLDAKLARMASDPSADEFIIADAKDADMAFGIAATGMNPGDGVHGRRYRTIAQYRDLIRENTQQAQIDIMLMSASTSHVLAIEEGLFDDSPVTPAIRANDTTDIWQARGSAYAGQPSLPFRSASVDSALCGEPHCSPDERRPGVDLGLYSITFNNDASSDRTSLDAYAQFRAETSAKGFRHFLEFFNPNAPLAPIPDVGAFMNDMIVRTLAGISAAERPLFLKVAYQGPAAMEELAGYDSSLIIGIMGGSSGTTRDAFHQLWEARRHGARAALYGRMINNAEDQTVFIAHLRALADGRTEPAEAVRSYHAELARLGIRPHRSLEDDLQRTKAPASP